MNIEFMPFLDTLSYSLHSQEITGVLFAVVSSFCWAASASMYKKGLEDTDPWSGNLMRTAFACLGFFILIIINKNISYLFGITLSLFVWLFFSAFFAFFVGDILFFTALKEVGVSRSVPVSSTYPLFVTVWAFIIYRRPVSIFIVLGTILIVVAIKLISEESGEHRSTNSRGVLMALTAAVCWSLSVVVLDYLVFYLPSEVIAGARFLITFSLTGAIVSTKTFTFSKNALLWIGIGGASVLVLGNYIFLEAVRLVSSAKVAPISATYPVISVFMASLLLREKITLKIAGGTILSFLGVLLVVIG